MTYSLQKEGIWAVPSLHYTMELAGHVKLAFDSIRPDCVAVELPETIQEYALRAAARLPDISVIQTDALYYMCEPCDPAFEGLRSALESGVEAFCIDLDVRDYPLHREPVPDPYAILHIGLQNYYEAYATKGPIKDQADFLRELHMARRLKELSLRYDNILFIGGMSHTASVLELMSRTSFEPSENAKRSTIGLATLTEEACREVMGEWGWLSTAYEQWRSHSFEGFLDRRKVIYHLYKQAAENYREATGNPFLGYHLRNTMKFVRNYAWVHDRLMPDLFEILAAARGCVDHNYAYETWLLATGYPYLKNIDNLPALKLSVEEIWGHPKQIRFHLKQKRRKGYEFQKRLKDKEGIRLRPPFPFSICSYPPEDQVIENFGDFLKKKGKALLTEENGKTIPFTTSLEEGIDTRETIRHFQKLYVKAKGRPPGEASSVVIIFNEDKSEEYPWRTTWHGEHHQESDMAFYATPVTRCVVGPGISRCEYGGLMLSYPPRRMMDVWRDPDYLECLSKAELLLMAAIDYAIESVVVFVSEKPPRSKIRHFAARFGKKIVYIPLRQLSPTMLNKIRVFHVLDGYDKREIAGDYIF